MKGTFPQVPRKAKGGGRPACGANRGRSSRTSLRTRAISLFPVRNLGRLRHEGPRNCLPRPGHGAGGNSGDAASTPRGFDSGAFSPKCFPKGIAPTASPPPPGLARCVCVCVCVAKGGRCRGSCADESLRGALLEATENERGAPKLTQHTSFAQAVEALCVADFQRLCTSGQAEDG
eukprot:scaffold447_cov307-Pinguiococcus_pyrenoidosus.AAC.13